MKKFNSFLSSFLLMAISNVVLADSLQQDFMGRLQKQINYVEQNQQAVWPGFHPAAKPTIVEFITRDYQVSAYALNFKPGSLPWKKLSIDNMTVYFLEDPRELNIINDDDFMEIDGQVSFVDVETADFRSTENLRPKIIASEASAYLMHESAIDPAHAKYLSVDYDNFNDPRLLKLFYLEDRALTLSQQDDTGLSEEALRQAVAIHQYRNHLTSRGAREFEDGLEIMDGVPIFIGWSSQQLNDVDYRKKSERSGCIPLNALAGSFGMYDCVMSGFPAFASAVYGRALDKKMDGRLWKQKVEKEFKSPSQLAIEYYHFTDAQAKEMTDAVMQNPAYNYDRIVKVIDHTMSSYLKAFEAAKTTYQNMRGVELRLPFEFGYLLLLMNAINGGDSISNFYIVNNHIVLLEDINMDSDDDDFMFKHLPYIAITEFNQGFDVDEINSYTSLKLLEDAKLTFDDNTTITASEFARNKMVKSFHRLVMEDQYTRLLFDREGTLDASQGMIVIKNYEQQKLSAIKVKHLKELLHEKLSQMMLKQKKTTEM